MNRKNLIALLLVFFLANLLQSGRWAMAPVAWIAPAIGLYIIHRQSARLGFLLLVLASYLALLISWRGLAPFPFPIYPILMLVNAFVGSLPFLLDRLLRKRLGDGFANTLVFPLAGTALEFLTVGSGPLGSFGAAAYTQTAIAPLSQLASVGGLWAISFLVTWFASVLYWAVDRHLKGQPYARGAMACALAIVLVLGWGGWRLQSAAKGEVEQMVTVAGITTEHTDMAVLMKLFGEDPSAFAERTSERHQAYLGKTREAAAAGAKIVLWTELAGLGLAEDVEGLIQDGRALADELDIYLAMPVFIASEEEGVPSVNKLVLAGPEGQALLEHVKYGGNIVEGTEPGPQTIQAVDSPYGRLSAVICWDTDYPAVIRQAGQAEVDLLLSPAFIWPEAARMHAEMAGFRSIENGMTIFRHSDDGFSRVIDAYGRTIEEADFVGADESMFLAEAPIGRVATLYPAWGDWVGWVSVVGLVLIAGAGLVHGWRKRRLLD